MPVELSAAAPVVGALEDDLRRRMYLFIRSEARPVSRDEAAAHVGISRKLAAFHLDKLVERGLLVAHYARISGRTGPGAGRSSKLYEPSGIEVEVSIPQRRYDLVGEALVDALADDDGAALEAAKRAANRKGRALGQDVKSRLRLRPPGGERALAIAEDTLAEQGYEPYRDGDSVRLRNCPFHRLAQQAPDIVCALNRELVDGLLRGLGNASVDATLDPRPGQCCVRLTARSDG